MESIPDSHRVQSDAGLIGLQETLPQPQPQSVQLSIPRGATEKTRHHMSSLSRLDHSVRSRPDSRLGEPRAAVWFESVIAALVVIVIYVWFVSVGYWTWWPKTTYTYDLLGSAFRSGQLSLQETPDPALLALPNPYDPAARVGIQYPWDASFYGGKYYLYWGPTPGLVLGIIKLFYTSQIADQYLVFAFVLGIFALSCLLLLSLWRRYFIFDIPAGVAFVSFLALGLAGPATWLLNRPAGYEAAIAGGQFLFIAGLYCAWSALRRGTPSTAMLAIAGVCWALALGSRVSIVFPIAVMTLVIVVRLARHAPTPSVLVISLAGLTVPLALGVAGLAWYNWARFGSPAEFGLRYQLTLMDLNEQYSGAFSIHYIGDNLRNYLINPIAVGRTFPFVTPLAPRWLPVGPALKIPPPEIEPVTGLLVSAPFLVYALLALFAPFARPEYDPEREAAARVPSEERSPRWFYVGLLGCAAISFLFILLYFYPTMRQLEDVVPVLALPAVLGFWEGWRYVRHRCTGLAVYALVASVIILISILASSLLAVTSYDDRFQHLNRELLRQLIRFFGH